MNRSRYFLRAVLVLILGVSHASLLRAETPLPPGHLIGPVEGAILSPGVKVCPGAPILLNATWSADGPARLDRNLPLRFEVVEGSGWYEDFEGLVPKVAGRWDLWKGRYRAWRQGKLRRATLSAGAGATGVVFHPLGKEGDQVTVRVVCEVAAPAPAPLEYRFLLGRNRSVEFAALMEKGIAVEEAMDNERYTYDENINVQSLMRSGQWSKGRVYRMERILENGYVVSKDKDNDKPRTDPRVPYNAAGSPYRQSVYWGTEGDAFLGCMIEPGDSGALMLYSFDGNTGAMTGQRGYGPNLCCWGIFTWVPGLKGLPFMTEVKKRLWSPPGRLTEDTTVVRSRLQSLP